MAQKKPADGSEPTGVLALLGAVAQRWRTLAVLLLVVAAAPLSERVWRSFEPQIANQPQYLVRPENVSMTPNPEWVTADVLGDVLRSSGLTQQLSVLDRRAPDLVQDAFGVHPWVASVDSVEKRYPPALHVEVTYRKPVAAIEMPGEGGSELLPIDKLGTLLPAADVPDIRRRYLPRIRGIVGRPPVGQVWTDPRVTGAATLAHRLGEKWEELHLVDILPSARPEIRAGERYYVYDLITRGGTRIVWGAAPDAGPKLEDPFETKLDRLLAYVRQNGPLDSVLSPQSIEVRTTLTVTARTAKLPADADGEEATQKR